MDLVQVVLSGLSCGCPFTFQSQEKVFNGNAKMTKGWGGGKEGNVNPHSV